MKFRGAEDVFVLLDPGKVKKVQPDNTESPYFKYGDLPLRWESREAHRAWAKAHGLISPEDNLIKLMMSPEDNLNPMVPGDLGYLNAQLP